MTYWLLLIILIALALYTVIPDLFLHRLGIGSWKRQYGYGVAITFDDGPNPDVTPHILDILDEWQVKATFFLIGKKAIQYPELTREIISRGHQIGAHSRNHKYAWFMSPWQTWREWEESIKNIEAVIGREVDLVRPPWGTFNLVLWLWLKIRRKRAVLWNIEAQDWKQSTGSRAIVHTVKAKAKEGSIVVLHDAGGEEGAPRNTLQALDHICRSIIEEKKLPVLPLEFPAWPFRRRLIHTLWGAWENYFARANHVDRVDATNILRLATTTYHGPEIYSEDGTLLAKTGDTVGEIHLDSIRMQSNETDLQKIAIKALRRAKESLPKVATYVSETDKYKDLKIFIVLSLMTRGVQMLGFHVQDAPRNWFSHIIGILQKIIKRIYHPLGKAGAGKQANEEPKLVWISKEELLNKWLPPL